MIVTATHCLIEHSLSLLRKAGTRVEEREGRREREGGRGREGGREREKECEWERMDAWIEGE